MDNTYWQIIDGLVLTTSYEPLFRDRYLPEQLDGGKRLKPEQLFTSATHRASHTFTQYHNRCALVSAISSPIRLSMADPFEVRMRFTHQLQHLNASVNSSQKAAHYAIKYRDMDEDLHSCILEQLEKNSMNNRANIMYFIEHLCDMAQRESHGEFVRMIQRDILRVVDAVAPADGSGAANVKVVRKVLTGLQNKSILLPATIQEIEDGLKERDTSSNMAIALPPPSPNAINAPNAPNREDTSAYAGSRINGVATRLDKRQIEQRIEEDRERHKRLREEIWAVGSDDNPDEEFDKMWDEVSSLGSDDFLNAVEEAEERKIALDMG